MAERKKILFVCTINVMRSKTAHEIYESDIRFIVKSAGTNSGAETVISREVLDWADAIVVMEKHHRNTIRKLYPDIYSKKRIVCLYIPDEYDYMQPELISVIRSRFEDVIRKGLI